MENRAGRTQASTQYGVQLSQMVVTRSNSSCPPSKPHTCYSHVRKTTQHTHTNKECFASFWQFADFNKIMNSDTKVVCHQDRRKWWHSKNLGGHVGCVWIQVLVLVLTPDLSFLLFALWGTASDSSSSWVTCRPHDTHSSNGTLSPEVSPFIILSLPPRTFFFPTLQILRLLSFHIVSI